MDLETLSLDVFLSEKEVSSAKGKKEYNLIWMYYDFRGDWAEAGSMGDVMESHNVISDRIVKKLGDIQFPNPVTEIVFHNGSKNCIESYNGHNDEVLLHKLDSQKYDDIFSYVKSKRPKVSYEPSILNQG